MCTQRAPFNWSHDLYPRHGVTIETYLRNTVVPALRDKSEQGGAIFLKEVKYRWSNHKIMNKWLQQLFAYLDRMYVKYHRLPTLQQVGLQLFKTEIYQNYSTDITRSILILVDQDRNGEIIDKTLVPAMFEMYKCLRDRNYSTYATELEAPFLESTRAYYRQRRMEWIANDDSIPDYLIKVERAYAEEQRLVAEYYLNEISESRVRAVVEDELMFVGFVLLLSGLSLGI